MKKVIVTAAVLGALVLNASAQRTSSARVGGTTVGIRGGATFFNITGKDQDGNDLDNSTKTGFTGGLNIQLPLGSDVYLQPGVDFTQKGAEAKNAGASNGKLTLNYIDVPLHIVYKPALGTGNIVVGAGPYVGFGIDGKRTYTNSSLEQDVLFTNDYNFSSAAPQVKKLDAGASFLAGYEFANKLSFNLTAQLGLMNINPNIANNNNDRIKLNNTGFGVGLGYRF